MSVLRAMAIHSAGLRASYEVSSKIYNGSVVLVCSAIPCKVNPLTSIRWSRLWLSKKRRRRSISILRGTRPRWCVYGICTLGSNADSCAYGKRRAVVLYVLLMGGSAYSSLIFLALQSLLLAALYLPVYYSFSLSAELRVSCLLLCKSKPCYYNWYCPEAGLI